MDTETGNGTESTWMDRRRTRLQCFAHLVWTGVALTWLAAISVLLAFAIS